MARPGKVSWFLDMIQDLGIFKRDASDSPNPLSSPIIIGDLVYCVTGNGAAFGSALNALPPNSPYVPRRDAPSFVAVNKTTGKLVWSSAAPGKNIQYGQWGSPAHARVAGVDQVLFPGGDGYLYGFEARTGREIWKVDCNLPSATRWTPDQRGTRTAFMSAPVVQGNVAYIGAAVDLEMTDMKRPLYAVELTHRGDATRQAIRWTYADDAFGGTFGALALGKNTLYALGDSGILVCLDPTSGKELWRSQVEDPAPFASPLLCGDKVLVAGSGKLVWFEDSHLLKRIGEWKIPGAELIRSTPTAHGNRIYIATNRFLRCLEMRQLP
jgi:outer membrane protein assembly factor BamB